MCVDAIVLPHGVAPAVRIEAMPASHYLSSLIRDRPLALQADFDVYLDENRLIHVKEPCSQNDLASLFFLHREPGGYG